MAFVALVCAALMAVSLVAAPPPPPANPGEELADKASAPNKGHETIENSRAKSYHFDQTATDADSREGRQYYGGGNGLRPYGYGGYGGYRGYSGGESGPSGYGGYGAWNAYNRDVDSSGYGGYRGVYGGNSAYGGYGRYGE